MATFSGDFTNVISSGATWYLTASYVVTPSADLTNYSVELIFKAKRSGWGNSYNNLGTSYITYTVNGVSYTDNIGNFSITGVDGDGGGEVTLGTYTYNVPASDIDFSMGIPVNIYWYTGILNNTYTPEGMSIADAILIPEEYAGLVYISNGTSWDSYMVYVSDGTNWNRHIPYISDGTNWNMCT